MSYLENDFLVIRELIPKIEVDGRGFPKPCLRQVVALVIMMNGGKATLREIVNALKLYFPLVAGTVRIF